MINDVEVYFAQLDTVFCIQRPRYYIWISADFPWRDARVHSVGRSTRCPHSFHDPS
jgi:hypothetical protein